MSETENIKVAAQSLKSVARLLNALIIIPFISLIWYLLPVDIRIAQAFVYGGAFIFFCILIIIIKFLFMSCDMLLVEAYQRIEARKHLERKE
jgi:hypothetical protein